MVRIEIVITEGKICIFQNNEPAIEIEPTNPEYLPPEMEAFLVEALKEYS